MKKILAILALLPTLALAQPAEQVDDTSKLTPGVTRGVAFMCVNSSDAIDASDFGTVRCGSTRQLMVEAIQSGTWNVGTVTTLTGITNPVAVTGTFWQATQPVSIAAAVTVAQATAANLNATVTDGSGALTVDGAVTVSATDLDIRNLTATDVVTTTPIVASANNDGACVSVTTGSTSLLGSFATRKWASIVNQGTALVYVKFGATATNADFPLPPGAAFNWPPGVSYTGAVDAISSSGTQSVCVVEF